MIFSEVVEFFTGVKAERKCLEEIAEPLSAEKVVSKSVDADKEVDRKF